MGRIVQVGSSVVSARRRSAEAGVEVSGPGMGILGVLDRSGPQRVSALARKAGMVNTLASRELRSLEQSGFVVREPDRSDGRAVVVSITDAGREAYVRLRAASVAAAGQALSAWKSAELGELARLLARLAEDFSAVR